MNAPAKFTLYLVFAFVGLFCAVLFFKATHHSDAHDTWSFFDITTRSDPGPPATEVRDLPTFESIDVRTAADFDVTIGTPQSVTIEAGSLQMPHIHTDVQDGKLVIESDDDSGHHHHGILLSNHGAHFRITVATLSLVDVEGAGRFDIHGLKGPSFDFQSEGASKLSADGKVDSLKIQIEGASKADTRALDAKNVVVEVDGVGDAEVRASDSLEATINGIGKIAYAGNPASIRRTSSGLGTITHAP